MEENREPLSAIAIEKTEQNALTQAYGSTGIS